MSEEADNISSYGLAIYVTGIQPRQGHHDVPASQFCLNQSVQTDRWISGSVYDIILSQIWLHKHRDALETVAGIFMLNAAAVGSSLVNANSTKYSLLSPTSSSPAHERAALHH